MKYSPEPSDITVIRLKSDNYDLWVSESAYHYIKLQMSTGDYHTHKARSVKIPARKFDPYSFKSGYLDIEEGEETVWMTYIDGDCFFEYYD